VNGNWTYTYDAFDRLASSSQNSGTNAFSYVYDRFGNRWQQNVTAGSGPISRLGFDANNHIVSGASYDAAGNVTGDGTFTYAYDAESRVKSVNGGSVGSYFYDAEGLRANKTTTGGPFDYLYDLAGHEITEISSSGWDRGEIYAADRHIATYSNGTTYFHSR
jgi:YD repeat-containing protein